MNPIREARTGVQDPSNGLRGYGTPPIQRGGRGSHSDTSSGLELDEVEGVKCTPSYPPPFLPGRYICTTADYIRSLFEFSGTLKGKCSRLGFFELTNFLIAQPYQSMLERGIIMPAPAPACARNLVVQVRVTLTSRGSKPAHTRDLLHPSKGGLSVPLLITFAAYLNFQVL